MTRPSPDIIKQALCSRDVKLNPPATDEQITLLNSRVGGIVHPYIASLYQCFNGFSDHDFDAKSMLEIWSIERIVKSKNALFLTGYMPFSDFFIDAEIFIQSFENPEAPVIAFYKGTEIASSTYECWNKFLLGGFDVFQGNST